MAQIFKRNGTWGYRVSIDRTHNKQKSGFKKKSDAIAAAQELELMKNAGTLVTVTDATFAGYFEKWAKTYKIGRLHQTTESKYKVAIKLVEMNFGNVKLRKVKSADYQRMLDQYAETHVKDSTRLLNSYFRNAVKYAINDGLLTRDFTFGALITGLESKDSSLKFLEYDEAERLKKLCIETGSFMAVTRIEILFGLLTGCRYGEVAGLTWDCVDFEARTITINKAYDYKTRKGFTKTKTITSNRTISITPQLAKILKSLQVQQRSQFLKQGFKNNLGFVFMTNRHEIPSDTAANKTLKKILLELKTKNVITFHGLRHTHASMLIAKGVSIDYISERLGHANTSVTYEVYTHLLQTSREREDEKALKILSNL
ncbi:site-specific integrase [Latilactobacillus curvatus]|uniref:tyrosine-type recombinase/integrase n=1 Tax=Latilactobacillus curvatus TaxID=28038 RepID=UPI0020C7711F|nr:site-specific integrase [Latilactobacillus curvatus]MCP8859475.1 site-specific integrase [Latilactobacillus curvatus]